MRKMGGEQDQAKPGPLWPGYRVGMQLWDLGGNSAALEVADLELLRWTAAA